MSIRRSFQCAALAASTLLMSSAFAQYTVSVQAPSTCNNSGVVTVNLVLSTAPGSSAAAGAQAFLSFDTGFTCTSITPGPSLQGIQLTFNNTSHTANVAVGTTALGQVISQGDVLATLTFSASTEYCAQSALVAFRTNNPPTRVTNNLAQALPLTTSDLGAVTLNDVTPPVITGGPVLTPIAANAASGLCSASVSISTPGATDNCSLSGVSGVRSDMGALTDPYPVGTTTITWTATDSCGNSSTATQNVVVTDTQPPAITCGSAIIASNSLGLCSATPTITPPTATDNCAVASVSFVSRSDLGSLTDPYPVGTTTITWRATDVNGLTADCTQDVHVVDTENPVVTAPGNITQNADAGTCTLTLSALELGSPTITDNCPGPYGVPIASLSLNGPAMSFPHSFPTGSTTVYWRVSDAHGNFGTATQTVTVNNQNTVLVNVALTDVSSGPFTRCVSFAFYTSGPCALAATASADVTFTGGTGATSIDVPCGSVYTAMTATDPKHTLRRTNSGAAFAVVGRNYVSSFTGSRSLQGGNVNDDEFIDILDFGGYIGQFGTTVGANSPCSLTGLHADFSGNGDVFTEDFNFISLGFLNFRETDPCGGFLQIDPNQPGGPRRSISVADLVSMGLRSYALADRNLDAVVNTDDIAVVLSQGFTPGCAADFNADAEASVQDVFDFLTAWFGNHPRSDVNNSGTTTTQDLFDFLIAWFAGC